MKELRMMNWMNGWMNACIDGNTSSNEWKWVNEWNEIEWNKVKWTEMKKNKGMKELNEFNELDGMNEFYGLNEW